MKPFLYILYICGLLSACTGKESYPRYDSFPDVKVLSAKAIVLDTALLRYPFRIAIKDSIAIVMDLHNADNYYHAFSYPAWKHIVSFGKRGEAPEEMLSAETFQFNSLDSIWTLDANKMQIIRWCVSPIDRSAKQLETMNVDKSLIRVLDFYAMPSHFLMPDYLGAHRYNRTNSAGRLLQSIGAIPTEKTYNDTSLPALAQAWRSFMDYHPGNGILAMVTQLGEVVEIYNEKDSTHTVLYGPNGEPIFQELQGEGVPTGIMGFSDVQVTDRYIYAVFHGRTFKEIGVAIQKDEKLEDGGRFIYVFDLTGKPVRQYTLDHAIYGIDVHEDTGIIFATDVNSDEPIIAYKM